MFSKLISIPKRLTLLMVALLAMVSWTLAPVFAASDPAIRTVPLTESEMITFADAELAQGKRLFNAACGRCHVGGQTYANPDVSLKLEDLEGAFPPRDTVMAMVDYIQNPTTYDGADSLVEYHPNTQLKSEYPRLRNLSDEDLKLISGYIMVQARFLPGWGGTKSETHSDLSAYL